MSTRLAKDDLFLAIGLAYASEPNAKKAPDMTLMRAIVHEILEVQNWKLEKAARDRGDYIRADALSKMASESRPWTEKVWEFASKSVKRDSATGFYPGSVADTLARAPSPSVHETIVLDLDLDTAKADVKIGHLHKAIQSVQSAVDKVRQAIGETHAARTAHRKEAWDDCKAVMIGYLKKLDRRMSAEGRNCTTSPEILTDFSRVGLDKIVHFISSFEFDASKP